MNFTFNLTKSIALEVRVKNDVKYAFLLGNAAKKSATKCANMSSVSQTKVTAWH